MWGILAPGAIEPGESLMRTHASSRVVSTGILSLAQLFSYHWLNGRTERMDPITLIVTALSAGLASALQDDAKAAYTRLRDKLRQRFSGRPVGEMVLAQHQTAPDTWEQPLRAELTATGAENDAALVDAAQALMKLVDEAGARSGKYDITIHGGQGIQIGDHNTQTNTFGR